ARRGGDDIDGGVGAMGEIVKLGVLVDPADIKGAHPVEKVVCCTWAVAAGICGNRNGREQLDRPPIPLRVIGERGAGWGERHGPEQRRGREDRGESSARKARRETGKHFGDSFSRRMRRVMTVALRGDARKSRASM